MILSNRPCSQTGGWASPGSVIVDEHLGVVWPLDERGARLATARAARTVADLPLGGDRRTVS
jgi:hypothetical protein